MVSTEQKVLGVGAELQLQGVQFQHQGVQLLGFQLLLGVAAALRQPHGCLLCLLWAPPQCQVEEVQGHLHVEGEGGEGEGEEEGEEAKEKVPNTVGSPKKQ